jgi:hypothetical protein
VGPSQYYAGAGAKSRWPKYTLAIGETMVLDEVREVKEDPDRSRPKADKREP